ncbi:galactose oxidase [Medicago truncatula]|uniref:Galactose oxidase n=1 Tax=Medicago truncatula TaxID=3880 RepID=A0A072URC5_MEDTR|nr:galactose oxidase [Medicago truncatula]
MSTSHLKSLSIDFEASLNDGRAYASQNLKFMLRGSYFDLKIIGSCRGFVLLHCSFTIYLWNPSTGFHKRIPLSPYGCNSFVNYFYGFGYDHSRDDYLMVSISHYANLVGIISHLEIFSLRDNTWKQMEGTHFPYTNVSYDLFEIPLPLDVDYESTKCDLWVFGEFLSLWALDYDNKFEIWVMKEYKVHLSWTKICVLSIGISTKYFHPICSSKNGDIIGTKDGTRLVKYNDKGQFLEYHSYGKDLHGSQVALYVESLFSLPGDIKQV